MIKEGGVISDNTVQGWLLFTQRSECKGEESHADIWENNVLEGKASANAKTIK